MIVNVTYLAELFGRTERTIQLWVNDGMPREANGEYNLNDCVKWRINSLEKNIDILEKAGSTEMYNEKLISQKLANRDKELAIKKRAGELIDAEAVRIAWTGETKNFGKALKALKYKLINQLQGGVPDDKLHDVVTNEIDAIQTSLSELRYEQDYDEPEMTENVNDSE